MTGRLPFVLGVAAFGDSVESWAAASWRARSKRLLDGENGHMDALVPSHAETTSNAFNACPMLTIALSTWRSSTIQKLSPIEFPKFPLGSIEILPFWEAEL
jgi:hypothetical protein